MPEMTCCALPKVFMKYLKHNSAAHKGLQSINKMQNKIQSKEESTTGIRFDNSSFES
jgi:hypothetical protein